MTTLIDCVFQIFFLECSVIVLVNAVNVKWHVKRQCIEQMKFEDRNDSTYMTIYFDKLEISKSTELPAYNSTRFLADIGGLIGLLIGMSLLSVFEVLVCLALYAVDKTCLLSVSRNCLCNLHHRNF